ncbi:hypothetical protein FY550_02460 [Kushneria phosphatilytica]|uniref:Uncharacterized protein n=1 Tax=Kushneria phosphatilytica TaxID=657387 RepID=A0A5C0ZUN8_9GAMM|nr:hypothetical protein [Kushneria phosphatilytica]QEL10102.1 hypothetical protein FY550_02460 [Kushneria phosphatilytica]
MQRLMSRYALSLLGNHRDSLSLALFGVIALSLWQPLYQLTDVLSLQVLGETDLFEALEHGAAPFDTAEVNWLTAAAVLLTTLPFHRIMRRFGYIRRTAVRASCVWLVMLSLTLMGGVWAFDVLFVGAMLAATAPLMRGEFHRRRAIETGCWLMLAIMLFGPGAVLMLLMAALSAPLWRRTALKHTDWVNLRRACAGAVVAALPLLLS